MEEQTEEQLKAYENALLLRKGRCHVNLEINQNELNAVNGELNRFYAGKSQALLKTRAPTPSPIKPPTELLELLPDGHPGKPIKKDE